MTVPIVRRDAWELFSKDGKESFGCFFSKEKAKAVAAKLDAMGVKVRVLRNDVFGELHPKGTRILLP